MLFNYLYLYVIINLTNFRELEIIYNIIYIIKSHNFTSLQTWLSDEYLKCLIKLLKDK